MSDPFEKAVKAVRLTAESWEPDNARRVHEWHCGAPDFVRAVSDTFTQVGAKMAGSGFPASEEMACGLGSLFGRFSEPLEQARSTFEREHAADLRRIYEPRPNQYKWDIARNRE